MENGEEKRVRRHQETKGKSLNGGVESGEELYPELLGHNSKAVHHAYAKHAEVTVPSLEDWEKGWNEKLKAETLKPELPRPKLLPVDFRSPLAAIAQSN